MQIEYQEGFNNHKNSQVMEEITKGGFMKVLK